MLKRFVILVGLLVLIEFILEWVYIILLGILDCLVEDLNED